jgi:hypothetical protein
MVALVLSALLTVQPGSCAASARAALSDAAARASRFDLASAAARAAEVPDCDLARVAEVYVRGLIDARLAAREGGTRESLAPVRRAIDVLELLGRNRRGPAEIARLVLQAAAAAAQSERDEMRIYLEAAVQMETVQAAMGEAGAPVVSAAEMAGALWLQVDRYEEAKRAYLQADPAAGTPSVLLGLARAEAGLGRADDACSRYRALVTHWGNAPDREEIAEGRAYLGRLECDGAVSR